MENNKNNNYLEIAGIKWATMNVGAKSVTDYGLYFQWGDTHGYTQQDIKDGKKKFASDWSDYKWYDTTTSAFTKYNSNGETLALEDDAVHAAWGGYWRMPTKEEFQKLGEAVTTAWTNDYKEEEVRGYICTPTAQTDSNKELFFPACGYISDGLPPVDGIDGRYWSSSNYFDDEGYCLDFNYVFDEDNYFNEQGIEFRFNGFSVRGVLDEK